MDDGIHRTALSSLSVCVLRSKQPDRLVIVRLVLYIIEMSMASTISETLGVLMSPDNDARRHAESYFMSQQERDPEGVLYALVSIVGDVQQAVCIRSLAGILLRRAVDKTTSQGSSISDATMTQLRQELLRMWTCENNHVILQRLSHVIAQSAANGNWMELIPCVIAHGNSGGSASAIPILNLIEIIAEYCPDDILTHLSSLITFFDSHLSSETLSIQVASARATGACIVYLDDDSARNELKPAIQSILYILGLTLSSGDEVDATGIMEYMVSVAQFQPMFFKGAMDHIVSAMLTVASSSGLEFSTRSIALELMVTITETAPALARRCSGLIKGLVPLAMSLMLEVEEEEEEWANGVYSEEPPDDNAAVGEEALHRAAAGMGGRTCGPPVVAAVEEYASSSEPTYRRAAVAALSRLAEGCSTFFKKEYLQLALAFLTRVLIDKSPRVQFQSIQAIGRFADLFPEAIPDIGNLYFDTLVAIMGSADTSERVKGHSVSALINMCRTRDDNTDDDTQLLTGPRLDNLLSTLCQCLQNSSIHVQPVCLTLLGCIAQMCGPAFAPYYASFMPGIKEIMLGATAVHMSDLRGKAMECVGLIGEAVSDDVFASDALEVMHILLSAMGECDDDTTFDYILPACARISHALGHRFEPFLPFVMKPLLAGARQQIQFSMEDAGDGETEGEMIHDEETGLESAVISLGAGVRKRVTLNIHAVQQKNQCGRMMYEYANNLKGDLKEYIGDCISATIVMVTDRHSSDVRSSASLALSKLFEAALDSCTRGCLTRDTMQNIMNSCVSTLLGAIKGEVNSVARSCAVESLRDILQACFESGEEMPDGSRVQFVCRPEFDFCCTSVRDMLVRCQESVVRRSEKEQSIKRNEGLDPEDEEAYAAELEEEEDLLSTLVDAMGQLLKLYGEALMPLFDRDIAPNFTPYLSPTHPEALQVVAVCMLDDMIEFGGKDSHKYIPQCLEIFANNLKSMHPVLRQSSAYGIAQAIRFAPDVCASHLQHVIPALVELALGPDASDESNQGITENALFALGIAYTNPSLRNLNWGGVEPSHVASIWIKALPFRADESEAKMASAQLCDVFEAGDQTLLGCNYQNLSEILRVFAEVFTSLKEIPLAHPTTQQRMKCIVQQMHNGLLPNDILHQAFAMLSLEQQEALRTEC